MNLKMDMAPTPSQTAGPFFHLGCTDSGSIGCLITPETEGERLQITCRVFDADGAAVNDAMIEIWQANAEGKYNHPEDTQATPMKMAFQGFGRLATDDHGSCTFRTIKPGRVRGNEHSLQAPHINVSIFARGLLNRLVTRIYFVDEPRNAEDPILALVPEERRSTLLARKDESGEDWWRFDVYLCGERETVFFDI